MCRLCSHVSIRPFHGAWVPEASSSPSISTSSADSSRADVTSAPDESDESSRFAAQHMHNACCSACPAHLAALAASPSRPPTSLLLLSFPS